MDVGGVHAQIVTGRAHLLGGNAIDATTSGHPIQHYIQTRATKAQRAQPSYETQYVPVLSSNLSVPLRLVHEAFF